ncbi:MAG: glycerol-3-phosphate dehydrogenase/oxidase [Gemmatimonadaceae bacterium]
MSKLGAAKHGATMDAMATDWRAQAQRTLEAGEFDLLVIGGGIVGCGIARDAALRGLTVALCEKDDFASGTSSRSSRLVHGGVRYLEHGHLHLVFESSRERRRLLRLAPHLVRPLSFTWPVYDGARVAHWKLLAGLTLYDALSLFRNVGNHRRLSAQAVLAREPGLLSSGLEGGAIYWDASTDDSRLTLANALGAARVGATVMNHARVTSLLTEGGRARGAVVRDAFSGREMRVRARCIVSAAGPWTDDVLRMEGEQAAPSVVGSAGVHIAVPRMRVGNREAVTLVAPQDGRVMFVLPAREHTIIGTTETPARTAPDHVRATREEVRYLLDACSAFFPSARLQQHDIVSAWSGIRPLAASLADALPDSTSREHTIGHTPMGVLSVTGGKLTTSRAMAEEVVDEVCGVLGELDRSGRPFRETVLPGGDMTSLEAVEQEARDAVGDDGVADRLVRAYGSEWRDVWTLADGGDGRGSARIDPSLPYIMAETWHAFERERACTLGDLLIRRLHVAFETRDHGMAAAAQVAPQLASRLGWDAARVGEELRRYEEEVERLFTIV